MCSVDISVCVCVCACVCVCVCVLRVLREQWIRAKYERKEFTEPAKSFTYEEGERRRTRVPTLVQPSRANQ